MPGAADSAATAWCQMKPILRLLAALLLAAPLVVRAEAPRPTTTAPSRQDVAEEDSAADADDQAEDTDDEADEKDPEDD